MKKIFLFFALLLMSAMAMSQIKVTNTGNIGLGILNPPHMVSVNISGNNKFHLASWINTYIDQTGNGTGAETPVMYPENNAWFQLGKPDKQLGNIYTYRVFSVLPAIVTSDTRAKENITPLENPIEKLKQISGYHYNIKREVLPEDISEEFITTLTKTQIGFLAQEVEKVFPELVMPPETEEEFCKMDYNGMMPILLEAIKEQQMVIESLQKLISKQGTESNPIIIEELQRKVENLEEALMKCCNVNSIDIDENNSIQKINITDPTNVAEEMKIYQNAPNPFNENTTIKCYIPPIIKKVELCIYNMQGIQVKCFTVSERENVTVQIQAGQLASGIYTYLLIGDGKTSDAKQMILTK